MRRLISALLWTVIAGMLTVHPVAAQEPQDDSGFIDVHMHLDGIYQERGVWEVDYDSAAETMLDLMDGQGVERAVLVLVPVHSGHSPEFVFENTLRIVEEYPERFSLMAGGGLLMPYLGEIAPDDVTPEIEAAFTEQAEILLESDVIGFGEILALHLCLGPTHSYVGIAPDHPLYLLLADTAAEHAVPIDLHMEAVLEERPMPENLLDACDQNPPTLMATVPAFERLLAHNREATIVWQHIGWDNAGDMTIELLRRLLDDHPNLVMALKIEGRPMQVGGGNLPMPNRMIDGRGQIKEEWLALFEDYPDRFVIGADEFIGVGGRATHGVPSFTETWAILSQLPPDLAQQIGHDNAARIYGLDGE
jgi:hypothetical protein